MACCTHRQEVTRRVAQAALANSTETCGGDEIGLQFRMHRNHPSLPALALADAQGRTFGIQMQVTGSRAKASETLSPARHCSSITNLVPFQSDLVG